MVTMNWTLDAEGKPVSAWKPEQPTAAGTREFATRYRKAMPPPVRAHVPARRRLLRTLTALTATVVVK